jgi:hypothetical protein
MKKIMIIAVVLFSLCNMAIAQKLTCQILEQELEKDKFLQLYWTQQLGEFILDHPMFRPSEIDSIWLGKKQVTASYYTFFKDSLTLMEFKIVVYNEAYELCFEDQKFTINTRFLACRSKTLELDSYLPVKKIYLRLTDKADYEPAQQELEKLCEKIHRY